MRGGIRVGTGPKPKPRAVVVGMDGQTLPDSSNGQVTVDTTDTAHPLLTPPTELPEVVKGVWQVYAPLALGECTLTEATAAGFREFCQQWVYLRELDVTLQRLGPGTKEAEPYFRTYLKLAQRLDSSLARFKLTAFGKPAVSEKPKPAANPWAQVAK
jgi:hypothetical protein